ncbi:hypothetical protein LTR85_008597 [Meristemomyces frigidus]|nr:hypothetical protein LTR85_008597 [Meristemomyces frigidus]
MAGEQEKSDLPGAFPQTPANEEQTFAVNPIPASEGAGNPVQLPAGEKVPEPSTINEKSVTSEVHDDPELKSGAEDSEKAFGVAPIPATGGIGNPVHLEPGEKVPKPSSLTGNTINSNVKLDKESYERSDTGAPMLPAPLSPQSEREAAGGASIFGLGPQTSNMIPESSMPMGKDMPADISNASMGPTISSVAPQSTTNELAGMQPLEASRSPPDVVTESQHEAHVDPEASANPEALQEKDAVESELQSKVPEAPATSESGVPSTQDKDVTGAAGGVAAASSAPAMVTESQQEAHVDPEASASPEAVKEKDEVESELQSKVPEAPATSESDPTTAQDKDLTGVAAASSAPAMVTESQQEAHIDPEASASPEAVKEKDAVESELQSKVPEAPATSESGTATKDSSNGYAAMASGGLAAAGTAALGTAFAMRNKATESTGKDPVSFLPQSVQDSINGMNKKVAHNEPVESAEPVAQKSVEEPAESDAAMPQQTAVGEPVAVPAEEADHARDVTEEVPEQVTTSQKEAHVDPEASASPTMVHEKNAMESELMSKVPETQATGEPAPTEAAALSATAPVATSSSLPLETASALASGTPSTLASGAPQLADPVSGVTPLSMDEKPVEGSKELNAPAGKPALPPTGEPALLPAPTEKPAELAAPPPDSRDVSPMSKVPTSGQTQPIITTGVESSKAPAESRAPALAAATAAAGKPVGTPRKPAGGDSSTPQKRQSFVDRIKGTPESSKSSGTEGSSKRRSFFGRIKDKLK